jgi:hypothetical protein
MSRNFSGCVPRRTKIASHSISYAALGINKNSVREKLLSSHQGWLCEIKWIDPQTNHNFSIRFT